MSYQKDIWLAHHGILGQKWGQRNGPPYPLGESDHSASEKKAGWKDSLVEYGAESRKTKRLKKNLEILDRTITSDKMYYEKNKDNHRIFNDADDRRTYKRMQNDMLKKRDKAKAKLDAQIEKDKKRGLSGSSDAESNEIPMKKHKTPASVDMVEANTVTMSRLYDPGRGMNCVNCATAYELRRRGYDVHAKPSMEGYGESYIKECFPDAKVEKLYADVNGGYMRAHLGMNKEVTRAVESKLLDEGNGARGCLLMQYDQHSGHAVNYEIKNDKLILRDCQTGRKYSKPDTLLDYCVGAKGVRLDNVDFDNKKIRGAVEW